MYLVCYEGIRLAIVCLMAHNRQNYNQLLMYTYVH